MAVIDKRTPPAVRKANLLWRGSLFLTFCDAEGVVGLAWMPPFGDAQVIMKGSCCVMRNGFLATLCMLNRNEGDT